MKSKPQYEPSEILTNYLQIKEMVDAINLDVHKNSRGNSSSGVRIRHVLRELKRRIHELTLASLELDNKRRNLRKMKKEQKQRVNS